MSCERCLGCGCGSSGFSMYLDSSNQWKSKYGVACSLMCSVKANEQFQINNPDKFVLVSEKTQSGTLIYYKQIRES